MKLKSRPFIPARYLYPVVLATIALLIVSCEEDNARQLEEEIKLNDTYLCPPVPQGHITVIGHEARTKPFLGAGYDVTGDFLSNSSVKDLILDLNKIPDEEVFRMKPLASFARGYEGLDITDFLSSIQEKNKIVTPSGNPKEVLFTGTIDNLLRFTDPDDYSSLYSFVCEDGTWTEEIQRLSILRGKDMLPYLSDSFREDLMLLQPKQLIEKYGTHILKSVSLGSRTRTLYRSVIANNKKQYASTAYYGLTARQKQIFRKPNITTTEPAEEVSRNHGGTIFVECFGGDYTTIPLLILTPNEVVSEPMDLSKWRASLNSTNMALSELSPSDLLPISELITDPVQKKQVEEAVREHIRSRQLKIKQTAPLFEATNGMYHKYFISYNDFQEQADQSWTCGSPLGGIHLQPQPGTTPLYQYSNSLNDRLTLETNDIEEMSYQRIAGYVYRDYQKDLIEVYEIWNGMDYAYTTENKETYGKNKSWKKTGVIFYLKKIA